MLPLDISRDIEKLIVCDMIKGEADEQKIQDALLMERGALLDDKLFDDALIGLDAGASVNPNAISMVADDLFGSIDFVQSSRGADDTDRFKTEMNRPSKLHGPEYRYIAIQMTKESLQYHQKSKSHIVLIQHHATNYHRLANFINLKRLEATTNFNDYTEVKTKFIGLEKEMIHIQKSIK